MRHQVKGFKLGRTAAHRKATLSALTEALIQHKRIQTTHVKAKALRMYVEPLINKTKSDTTANRRLVFAHLQSKDAVKELFDVIGPKVADRPGGYTRIVKLGQRPGDGTEMAVIELVDFNETGAAPAKKKTRRTRRSSGGTATKAAKPAAEASVAPEAVAPEATKAAKAEAPAVTPETASDASAQAPGTPLDAPEATAGHGAANPQTAPGTHPDPRQD